MSKDSIGHHLKRAEPRPVSFPPFRGIGPLTHLLGVGRGDLTSIFRDDIAQLYWIETFFSANITTLRQSWRKIKVQGVF